MNRNIEVYTKIYKPYKINKINSVLIFRTMDGNIVIKPNTKINYPKLYNYLKSRNFNYIPDILPDSRDGTILFKYEEDFEIDNNQKILDLMNLVSLLHSKTSYFKEISNDKYKELYQQIKDKIDYTKIHYDDMFMKYIHQERYSPSEYLFLRNYSLIDSACNFALDKLEEWYINIKEKNKQRVVLVHNNLKLEHYIKNEEEFLISWDNYTFDSPILDLYNLYKNEWHHTAFEESLEIYTNNFSLSKEEKLLFITLISIPYELEKQENELEECRSTRTLINYLMKTSKTIDSINVATEA